MVERFPWPPHMGSVDIRATFKKRKHELNVTTYAMAILTLFNDLEEGSALTLDEIQIQPRLSLSMNLYEICSRSLLQAKVAFYSKSPCLKTSIRRIASYSMKTFSSQHTKIKIIAVAGSNVENQGERKELLEKVEEMRNIQVEAAIVRIMKDRKILDHNNLIAQVTRQLNDRFLASPAIIKRRIDALIEREYLERENTTQYKYLA